jgi:hypothetical protein
MRHCTGERKQKQKQSRGRDGNGGVAEAGLLGLVEKRGHDLDSGHTGTHDFGDAIALDGVVDFRASRL